MAADFMAQRGRLRNNIFLVILMILPACNSSAPVLLSALDSGLQAQNGILYLNGQPYTGRVSHEYPGTSDTAGIFSYLDGKEHGIWKRYYASGKLQETRYFDHGNKTGAYLAWWENGRKKLEYQFDDDEYEGTCREWNSNGRLIKEMNYTKGYEAGPQRMFYDNGKVRSNYVIVKGRRYGLLGTKNCINVTDSVFKN